MGLNAQYYLESLLGAYEGLKPELKQNSPLNIILLSLLGAYEGLKRPRLRVEYALPCPGLLGAYEGLKRWRDWVASNPSEGRFIRCLWGIETQTFPIAPWEIPSVY